MILSLKAARYNAGLTQIEAAKLIGVSRTTISNWESGKHSPYPIHREIISQVYEVPMENLNFND